MYSKYIRIEPFFSKVKPTVAEYAMVATFY